MGESLGYRWLDRHGRGHEDLLRPDGSIVCTLTADRHRNGDTDLQPVPEELDKLVAALEQAGRERDELRARAEKAESACLHQLNRIGQLVSALHRNMMLYMGAKEAPRG